MVTSEVDVHIDVIMAASRSAFQARADSRGGEWTRQFYSTLLHQKMQLFRSVQIQQRQNEIDNKLHERKMVRLDDAWQQAEEVSVFDELQYSILATR